MMDNSLVIESLRKDRYCLLLLWTASSEKERDKTKLHEINLLYKKQDDDVDKVVKNMVEVAQTSTWKTHRKWCQSYTIRELNRKAPKDSDIEQYKLVNVGEELIDNWLKYLDAINQWEVSLSHSEYVKSKLYSIDSHFIKFGTLYQATLLR